VSHPAIRLKYVSTLNNEALGEDTDPDYELQYIDIGNVDSSGQVHEVASYRFADAPSRARRRVRHGDVIVSCVRTYLQAIAPIESPPDNLIVSTGFAVVRPIEGRLRAGFCKYALREPRFLAEVERRSVGVSYPAINSSDLAAIPIPAPPDEVQLRIEKFLDRETARLDALVAAKQRLLDLLAEKRKAIIATAVTRGLDPKVKLRDSGVPWLGEIPAHWEHRNLRFCCTSIQTGGTPAPEFLDYEGEDGLDWLTPGDLSESLVPERSSRRVGPGALSAGDLKMFPRGAVLVVGIGATLGKVALLEQVASANQQVNALTPREDVDGAYLAYEMSVFGDLLRVSANTATLPILNQQRMGDLTVLVPPLAEQQAIVEHIARETAKLDAVRAATERTIALLKERRAALIAAAVTGQLDVEAAA
jgi:type I restriction enzyme S subunit